MAKKKKSKKGMSILVVAVLGVVLLFLLNGNFSFDLFGGGEQIDSEVSQTDDQTLEEESNDIVIEVLGNKILVNGKEVYLENLMLEIGEKQQVILRAKEAKQIKYDDVKTLLESKNIIIIEE